MTERYARITGWGKYLPTRRLTNYDLEQMVETNDEWITHNTGIRERRIAEPQETTVDMALNAALYGFGTRVHARRRSRYGDPGNLYSRLLCSRQCEYSTGPAGRGGRPVRSTLRPVAPVFFMAWSPPRSLSRTVGLIASW